VNNVRQFNAIQKLLATGFTENLHDAVEMFDAKSLQLISIYIILIMYLLTHI